MDDAATDVGDAPAPVRSGRHAIYVPTSGPADWQALLADPQKHWRTGYSARTLAYAWEEAGGIPAEVGALFGDVPELLFAVPEHKVPLEGGRRESQNDLFALVRFGGLTSALTVEGKVNEPFDRTAGEWFAALSEGKQQRMRHLCAVLGLTSVPPHIRYQLLHRTASALIEAKRFKTDEAAMIVHSFSPTKLWFEDFARFAELFDLSLEPDTAGVVTLTTGQRLRLGWASGNPAMLVR